MKAKFESERHARAYLMGVYLSDGSISQRSGHFTLQVNDKEFRDEAAVAMELVGARVGQGLYRGVRYWLREKSPYPVGRRLEREFPVGKDHLPFITDDIVRDLVAGIMDGDGCISLTKQGYYRLKVCGRSRYLADLQKVFAKHDVLMHYHPTKPGHSINIKSFATAEFYFRMPRKQARLEVYKKTRRYLA